jgi:hypothetical protein
MEGWAATWKKKDWWRTNKERAVNVDLWERLLELCALHQIQFRWVRGHAGNKENELCDQLSCAALRQPNLATDEGYENKPALETQRTRLSQEGQPCWKCATPVVKQKSQKKPKGDYYFEYYLYCPKCQATYMVDEAKRFIEQPPSLF